MSAMSPRTDQDVLETWQILDVLSALVEKSLVVYEEDANGAGRYRLLETVRQYGNDRRLESGESTTLRDQHRAWCLELTESAGPHLHTGDQIAWLDRLDTEHDNLRAALEGARAAPGEDETLLGLAGALSWFWHLRSHLAEGRGWLEEALARMAGMAGTTPARARALQGAGQIAFYQHDYVAAQERLAACAAAYQTLGDRRGYAFALIYLASATAFCGDLSRSRALLQESVARWREENDPWGLGMALWMLGCSIVNGRAEMDEDAAALPLLNESAVLLRKTGDRWALAAPLHYLGVIAERRGDHGQARRLAEEGLALSRAVGDKWRIGMCLNELGRMALAEGEGGWADALLAESETLWRNLGNQDRLAWTLLHRGHAARQENDPTAARACYTAALTLLLDVGIDARLAETLDALADLAAEVNESDETARLRGAARALHGPTPGDGDEGVLLPEAMMMTRDEAMAVTLSLADAGEDR